MRKEAPTENVTQNRRKGNGIEVSFTCPNLTLYGGMGLFGGFVGRLHVKAAVDKQVQLARKGRRYSSGDMILSLVHAQALDLERLSDTALLHRDGVFQQVVGLDDYPHQTSLGRFLGKFNVEAAMEIGRVNVDLWRRVRGDLSQWPRITLDMDSHVITAYGKQQRAKVGYNPKKPGRKSYHPLLCFLGETRDFLWGRFRPGDTNNLRRINRFLKECLAQLPSGIKELFLRADSGFFGDNFLRPLEGAKIKYAVVAKLYPALQCRLGGVQYRDIGGGVEVGEFMYQAVDWKRPRRMIVIRQEIKEGEKKKKEPKLLELKGHTYQVIVTAIEDWAPEEVWRFYNDRANVENMLKEGMMGYGLDAVVSHKYGGNMAHFYITMLTYNLMNWFKESVLGQEKVKRRCPELAEGMAKWVRQHFFLIAGRLVSGGRKLTLRLSEGYPWKEEYYKAECRLEALPFPLTG